MSRCVVIEDSLVGLRAAKGAGMLCIITYTESTKNEDFYAEVPPAQPIYIYIYVYIYIYIYKASLS